MKNNKLDEKLSKLEKEFGLSRTSSQKKVERIRTGYFCLDYVLDEIKLVEGGHKIELYGRESSGKSTFAKLITAKYQQLDKVCVWVVSEGFDEEWATHLGVCR